MTNIAIKEKERLSVYVCEKEKTKLLQHIHMLTKMIQQERKIMQGRKRMTPEAKSLYRQEAIAQMEGPASMWLRVRKGKILDFLVMKVQEQNN